MNKFTRRFAAVLATGALIAAGLTLTATAANATSITGNIKLFTSGSAVGTNAAKQITSGSSTTNPMIWGLTIDQACPANYRGAAIFTVFQSNVKVGTLGSTGYIGDDGVSGINGLSTSDTSIAMDESSTLPGQNLHVDNNKSLEVAAPTLATGSFELRYYCGADAQGQFDYVADKFFTLTLNFDKTAHTWSTPPVTPPTTTAITAAANQAAKTVTVGTTIKDATGTTALTAATGTATVNQTAPTAAVLGTVTIAAGVATFTTGVLAPGTYQFTVTYSGDAAYNGSTSGTATGTINGPNSGATNITFTVDANSGGGSLTLSNVPSAVDLGHATLNGGLLTAANSTGFSGITVTDTRSINSAAWNLTGQMGSFTNGTYNLGGKYLGWTPYVTSGPATPGATVLANNPGLGNSLQLATAPVTNGSPVSVVGAGLNVAIPSNSATGLYTGVLTLTLA
jgi:hypothetical protein